MAKDIHVKFGLKKETTRGAPIKQSVFLPWGNYCEKCGSELKVVKRKSVGFSRWDGSPLFNQIIQCPKYSFRDWLSLNPHTKISTYE